MRPSTTAVVGGLPRSWQTAPSITVIRRGRSRSPFNSRALSTTSNVWVQTSPSGCHSGSCSQPTSDSSSGRTCLMTPRSSASRKPIDGRSACNSSFSISPQIRSAGRSSSGSSRQSAAVAGVERELEPRGELHGAQRTQAIVRKRLRIDGAQQPARQVRLAIEGVFVHLGQRIPRDGVDGEVAASRGFRDRHRWIAVDLETLVTASPL